jgi:SAM-dependent methyltransferase
MHPALYAQVFSVQASHWWGRSRRALSLDLLEKFGLRAGCRYLDIGCGTGQNLRLLERLRPTLTVGADVSPIALSFARKACPRCQLVRLDVNQPLPFPDKSFDVATIFNVLYHAWIKNDLAVLKEAGRVLKSDGLLLVTEPAFEALAREVDVADMAARRYRLRPFVELLGAAGFDVLFANCFTSFGAPVILAMKALKALAAKPARREDPADVRPLPPLLNAALYGLARIDAALVRASVPMPFGTTLICVARPRRTAIADQPNRGPPPG